MKRIISIFAVLLLIVFCGIPCFAESSDHNVSAKYVDGNVHYVCCIVRNGKATVQLASGIEIDVSNLPSDDFILCVREITKADETAMQWFSDCLPKETAVYYPYDIYLKCGNERVELTEDVDIRITFPQTDVDTVYLVSSDGTVSTPEYQISNTITFRSKLDTYCVMVSSDNQSSPIEEKDTPWVIIAVSVLTSGVFVFVILKFMPKIKLKFGGKRK